MIPRPDPSIVGAATATDARIYGIISVSAENVPDPHADTVKMSSQQADALEAAHMLDLAEGLKRRLLADSKFDDAFLVEWLISEIGRHADAMLAERAKRGGA